MELIPFDKIVTRNKPVIGKLSFTDEDVRNSPFITQKIENAKRRLKENPFPVELLESK